MRVVTPLADGFDHVEPVAVAKAKVDHGIFRRGRLGFGNAFRHRFRRLDCKAACLHRPRQPAQKGTVVIDDQQCGIGANMALGILGPGLRGNAFLIRHFIFYPGDHPPAYSTDFDDRSFKPRKSFCRITVD